MAERTPLNFQSALGQYENILKRTGIPETSIVKTINSIKENRGDEEGQIAFTKLVSELTNNLHLPDSGVVFERRIISF